jgi:uncharacterized protein
MPEKVSRITVVDALRGFAIVSIMLLHNIEHFDLHYTPSYSSAWLQTIDSGVWNTVFFLFAGKSYAIFALLFGLTFFIQSSHQQKLGKNFDGRFAWRMFILFMIGLVNSAFYQGDILSIYALIGVFLIPLSKAGNRFLIIIAIIMLSQPYELVKMLVTLHDPGRGMENMAPYYYEKTRIYLTGKSFVSTVTSNLTIGKTAVYIWSWESGRFFQTLSLFIFGMLAGRFAIFSDFHHNEKFWIRSLLLACFIFVLLFEGKLRMDRWNLNVSLRHFLFLLFTSWSNLSFMAITISLFVILYQSPFFQRLLKVFSPIGRMSLSNYFLQSVFGTFIYYGYGLGLYFYTGAYYCLIIGLILSILQLLFSKWWLGIFDKGPLETFWHTVTWIYQRPS